MASLPSLAEIADVEKRLGREITDDAMRDVMQSLLDDASVVVRAYCRRDFTLETTVARLRPSGNKIKLPGRPVVNVISVKSVMSYGPGDPMITPLSYYSWPGGNEITLGDQSLVINGPTYDVDSLDVWFDVEYSHGYAHVPDDVITVVANLAKRNFTVPGGGLIDLQTVGPYTTRYAGYTSAGPLSLAPGDRDVLNRYRSTGSYTVEMRG